MDAESILTTSEVHLWLAPLEQPAELVSQFHATLTSGEQERAARFVFEKDRRHFTVARGILRALLGHYLQVPASAIRFVYNAYGRPALASPAPQPALNFNLSHSHQLALYAFAPGREVGVDIEYMREMDMDDYLAIARSHFSPGEYGTLQELPASLRKQGFFNCWTRKEAYIKTRGQGLAIPLDSFDVTLAPGEPIALLASREAPHTASAWSLSIPTVPPDYAAALMVEGHDYTIRAFSWPADFNP